MENLDVVKGIPVERMMIETDSPYCEIKNTHAGINFVKSVWPSKKKEKYDDECTVKGRNEPCFVRCEHYLLVLGLCSSAGFGQVFIDNKRDFCTVKTFKLRRLE